MGPSVLPAGTLGKLLTQEAGGLQALLDEEAEVLWRNWRWQLEPWAGPCEGLTWVDGGKVLGYLQLRISGGTVVAGRLFASRSGPVEAVEAALLDAAIRGAFALPAIQRLSGELFAVAPATLALLRALAPAQVRVRALMGVTWTPSARAGEPALLEPWHADHFAAAAELLWRTHAEGPQDMPDPAFNHPEGLALLLRRILTHPVCGRFEPGASFVARDPGSRALLGFALASRMGPDQGHLTEVAVDPGARRKGLGKALVTRVLDALQGLGCPGTHLVVNQDNAAAVALYGSLGFRERHRFPDLRLQRKA